MKIPDDPVRLESRTPGLRVKHFTTVPSKTPPPDYLKNSKNPFSYKTHAVLTSPKSYLGIEFLHHSFVEIKYMLKEENLHVTSHTAVVTILYVFQENNIFYKVSKLMLYI